jgi:hypothetical protein
MQPSGLRLCLRMAKSSLFSRMIQRQEWIFTFSRSTATVSHIPGSRQSLMSGDLRFHEMKPWDLEKHEPVQLQWRAESEGVKPEGANPCKKRRFHSPFNRSKLPNTMVPPRRSNRHDEESSGPTVSCIFGALGVYIARGCRVGPSAPFVNC